MNTEINQSTVTGITFAPDLEKIMLYLKKNIINKPTIKSDDTESITVDLSTLLNNNSILPILPSLNPLEKSEIADRHDAEPIKSKKHISMIIDHYISNNQYRDAMLFILGINFGLRVSDLRLLRIKELINNDMTFKHSFSITEKKTRNTKGRKRFVFTASSMVDMTQDEKLQHILDKVDDEIDTISRKVQAKPRTLYINEAVRNIVTLYLQHMFLTGKRNLSLDDYLFVAEESNNKKMLQLSYEDDNGNTIFIDKYVQAPLANKNIDVILKGVTSELGIKGRYSTHAYRKTFSHHILAQTSSTNKPDQRKLDFLQNILGHSNQATTLHYAGITDEDIENAYMSLNLGLEDILKYM